MEQIDLEAKISPQTFSDHVLVESIEFLRGHSTFIIYDFVRTVTQIFSGSPLPIPGTSLSGIYHYCLSIC